MLLASTDQCNGTIGARVGIPHAGSPTDMELAGFRCGLLDVGLALRRLEADHFDKSSAVALIRWLDSNSGGPREAIR